MSGSSGCPNYPDDVCASRHIEPTCPWCGNRDSSPLRFSSASASCIVNCHCGHSYRWVKDVQVSYICEPLGMETTP